MERVVLRDGSVGGFELHVNVGVLQALGLLPGDRCECSGREERCVVRLWPRHELPRGVAEAGRLLLLSLGAALGEAVVLRPLARPLPAATRVRVVWEGGAAGAAGLARAWRGEAVWEGAALPASRGGRTVAVAVQSVEPRGPAVVGPDTRIEAWEEGSGESEAEEEGEGTPELAALEARVRRAAAGALAGREGCARGLLLWGPPGCGKTRLLRRVFRGLLVPWTGGGGAAGLAAAVAAARARQPAVLLVDEADLRLGAAEGGGGAAEAGEAAAALMGALDALAGSRVAVAAAARRPEALPAALRRAGRLEAEIEVGPLSGAERRALLRQLLPAGSAVPEELELPGLVAGDVAAVAREARAAAGGGSSPVNAATVAAATRRVRGGAARGWEVELPRGAALAQARGMDAAKRRLAECVEWPLRHAAAFARLGVRPASGLLLYGPPGNGKTLLARGAAAELRCSFLLVKGPELYSKYVGESERALAAVFQQARRQHPCLVFLDEIDALAPRRAAAGGGGGGGVGDRMLAVLLAQLDGVSPLRGVTVVGATNRPDQLDPALLRPGRLSHLLYVPLPDAAAREELMLAALAAAPRGPELGDASVAAFARAACEGCSGAECAAIAREAKLRALARGPPAVVGLDDLHEARRACPPRTSPETIRFYEEWRNV